MPRISVLNYCYSRQKDLDHTLPLWLAQEGVDFEILIATGPEITVPNDPRIKTFPVNEINLCKAYNLVLKNSSSELILTTQCDIEVNDPQQMRRMLELWKPGRVITEKFFKQAFRNKSDGQLIRDCGFYLQMCLVAREELIKVGGWYEAYENPDMLGHEDGDIVASFLENGLQYYHTETPFEKGVFHLDHPVSYWDNGEAEFNRRINNAKKLFRSRHSSDIHAMYARQMIMRCYGPKT